MICLSKGSMEAAFEKYLETVFGHPEIVSAGVRDITIRREDFRETGKRAFEAGFHDGYSDIDLSVKVRLPSDGSVTPEQYMGRIDRFGVDAAAALGWCFVPEHNMYRIVFRDGMRYDFGFAFEYAGRAGLDLGGTPDAGGQNDRWPAENINRFWFVQVQALGKLYRKDHLISCHLANMNCNETLVMQMVLRDIRYGTSHHPYGHGEEPEYVKDLGKTPYRTGEAAFDRIADHLYAAALTCDRLAREFYPRSPGRSGAFFAIWDGYEAVRRFPEGRPGGRFIPNTE